MRPGRVGEHDPSDDALTRRYREFVPDEPGTVELVLEERPADPAGAKRVLANLERRLIGDRSGGTDITRYVLLQQIGIGGLGAVYAAYDPELDRRIALKFLHGRADVDPNAQERLVREAKAMAKLSHPNVVTVFDVGMVDGQVFIAMELVDGIPLSTFLRAKQRGWKQVRDVMVQAGRGLQAAHAAGLVHRDFKPQNVLVGADGRARVLDFGLARLSGSPQAPAHALPSDSDIDDRLTQTGALVGTPAYMAPEQVVGHEVGPAADQFGFCVALFEGLYGSRPFVGEGAIGVIAAIRRGHITPPRATRDVPAWLHKAVLRGLAHDPRERFGSMRELLEAITLDQRTRRRYGVLAVLLACVLGGLIGAGSVWLRPGPTDEERAAIEARVEAAREAAEAGDFVYPPPDDPQRETAYSIVRALERTEGPAGSLARAEAQQLRTDFGVKLVELGDRYWDDEGGTPFAADFYASALMFDESLDHARERASMTRGELHALVERADERTFSSGELVAAQSLAVLSDPDPDRRAERLDALAASGQPPSPTTAARLRGLVRTKKPRADRVARHDPESAPPVVRTTPPPAPEPEPVPAPTEDAAAKDQPRGDAGALVKAAEAALRRGDRKSAEQLYNQAIRVDRRHARALAGLAQLHFDSGQNHKAVTYAKLAVAAAPRNGSLRILLGDALVKTLDYDGAKQAYTRARALGSKAAGKRLALIEDKLGG
jgi:tetratricopeptide (TPR) repeat protein